MRMMVRAADAPARSRAAHWRQVLDQTLGPLEVRPVEVDRRDRLLVGDAGAVRVAELTAGVAGGADRTRGHIRRSDLDVCKIDMLAQGRGVVAQDGREASLAPGDLTFVDLSRPAHWTMSAMRVVAVVFPRALLRHLASVVPARARVLPHHARPLPVPARATAGGTPARRRRRRPRRPR